MANRDPDEQADDLGRGRHDVGRRFYDSAQRAFLQLAGMPGIGSPQQFNNPEFAAVRCSRVPDFENHRGVTGPCDP